MSVTSVQSLHTIGTKRWQVCITHRKPPRRLACPGSPLASPQPDPSRSWHPAAQPASAAWLWVGRGVEVAWPAGTQGGGQMGSGSHSEASGPEQLLMMALGPLHVTWTGQGKPPVKPSAGCMARPPGLSAVPTTPEKSVQVCPHNTPDPGLAQCSCCQPWDSWSWPACRRGLSHSTRVRPPGHIPTPISLLWGLEGSPPFPGL